MTDITFSTHWTIFYFIFDYGFSVHQLQFWIIKIWNFDIIVTYTITRRTWLHHLNICFFIRYCYKDIKRFSNFSKICSSLNLECNFSLVDLKYSPNFRLQNLWLHYHSRFLNSNQSLEYTTLCYNKNKIFVRLKL